MMYAGLSQHFQSSHTLNMKTEMHERTAVGQNTCLSIQRASSLWLALYSLEEVESVAGCGTCHCNLDYLNK
jgi:hypothetical protein